ncbi:MAG: hypothetical protein SVG88_14685 [Halobacteriales archaeon]|nr:hypothetical protein [Halobacteriales archaeon]
MTDTDSDPVLCPECGWSGRRSALTETDDGVECPICAENIELVE